MSFSEFFDASGNSPTTLILMIIFLKSVLHGSSDKEKKRRFTIELSLQDSILSLFAVLETGSEVTVDRGKRQ